LPEEAASGATPHRRAKLASLRSRCGLSPAAREQRAGHVGADPKERGQRRCSLGDQPVQLGVQPADRGVQASQRRASSPITSPWLSTRP
jgi:hypothetical protein